MSTHRIEILVVEDEEGIRSGLCDVLAYQGYQPTGAADGDSGLKEALTGQYDLLILDVMLPGIDGFEICQRAREALPRQPILMLTAKGSEDDIVHGFRNGCDDYVSKPFSLKELLARIASLLRRSGRLDADEPDPFVFGGWRVDPNARSAQRGKETITLTRREIALMALLYRDRGRIVSRRTLLREVWGLDNAENIQTRTVDVHIAKLRKKIDSGASSLIETVRGEGYRFLGGLR